MTFRPAQFSRLLLKWFDQYGRHDLPWQKNTTAYRVWVSEIMLQQTQVTTVIPYYQAFMKRFPTLSALAKAPRDEVLHLWTGLGYYARARNLHQCAIILQTQFKGKFPDNIAALCELPGIGRSTAGAILSIAQQKRAPILDGNVKRVLARFHCVEGWTGHSTVQEQLWDYAERYTPTLRVADYTQAIMDLGATVCTRTTPQCDVCPLHKNCAAYATEQTHLFPFSKPKKQLPVRKRFFLLLVDTHQRVWLTQRPSNGIWGGLWSFPEFDSSAQLQAFCKPFNALIAHQKKLPLRRHTFSHFHLDITPIVVTLTAPPTLPRSTGLWYNIRKPASVGLAAPVKQLLTNIKDA